MLTLNVVFCYPPLGGESDVLHKGFSTRSIVLDTELSVVSCRIVSVPKTSSGEGTGNVTQHIL